MTLSYFEHFINDHVHTVSISKLFFYWAHILCHKLLYDVSPIGTWETRPSIFKSRLLAELWANIYCIICNTAPQIEKCFNSCSVSRLAFFNWPVVSYFQK